MPDETKQDSAVERWADKILRWLSPLILAYIATIATNNHQRNETIEKKVDTGLEVQQKAVVKTEAVAADLSKATAKIEERSDEDVEVQRSTLYVNWYYLDGQAVTPAEKAIAAEKKKQLDEFNKKNPSKKK